MNKVQIQGIAAKRPNYMLLVGKEKSKCNTPKIKNRYKQIGNPTTDATP
jgi:hypothetical protein